jgi:tRNA pseudouridine38-40 synthase
LKSISDNQKNKQRTIRLLTEYDGSDFSGWQIQPNRRTVQGEMEKALKALTQEKIRITGAGRTDAGVHAIRMPVSFQCNSLLQLSAFKNGMNALLPKDIRIHQANVMNSSFDARRDAVSRTYRYILLRKPRVIGQQYAWYPKMEFSVDLMKNASKYLLGEHEWDSFCKVGTDKEKLLSRVLDIRWDETDIEVHFEITAERFFHNMIRIILGTLLEVGCGKISLKCFQSILESRDRKKAGPTIPPQGLFLIKVSYNNKIIEL